MQKMLNKLASFVIALVMVLGVIAPSVARAAQPAEDPSPTAVTNSVTLHKLLFTKEQWANIEEGKTGKDDTEYTGNEIKNTQSFFGVQPTEIDGVYFVLKTKEGQFVKAKGDSGEDKLTPVVNAGNVEKTTNIDEAVGGLTANGGKIKFITNELKGEFVIDEIHDKSTYVGTDGKTITDNKAVPVEITLPLVNNNGTVLDAHVYPKNTEEKPDTKKKFTEEKDNTEAGENNNSVNKKVGDVISYTVTTEVPANSKWKTAFWSDEMTEGLDYNADSLVVKLGEETLQLDTDYSDRGGAVNGFNIQLTEEGLKKILDQTEEKTITLTYTATLNGKAVAQVPESNDVTFHYGNNPGKGNTPIPGKPENGEITVNKTWAVGTTLPAEGINVTFTLIDAQTGEKVSLSGQDNPKVFNNVTDTNELTHTWTGLDNETEYKVVETWNGYSAEYTKPNAGNFGVVNHKDNNPEPINPSEPKVVTYGKKFVKTNQQDERLDGAEFAVKVKSETINQVGDTTNQGKYLAYKTEAQQASDAKAVAEAKQKLDDAVAAYKSDAPATLTAVKEAQAAYDAAYSKAAYGYRYVDSLDDALRLSSNAQGQFTISGLYAGTYELEETKQPDGYAKMSNVEFTVNSNSWTSTDGIDYVAESTSRDALQVINKKVTIPQTGGIGTIIFTVAGLLLMGGAFVAMRKNREEVEA